jgi:hypothetical protein
VGDFFLDKYLDIDPRLIEVSLETGKTAHQVTAIRHSPGAGTVVSNLSASARDDARRASPATTARMSSTRPGRSPRHRPLVCDPQRKTPTYLKPRDASDRASPANTTPTTRRTACRPRTRSGGSPARSILLPELDGSSWPPGREDGCGRSPARSRGDRRWAGRFPRWSLGRQPAADPPLGGVIIKPNQFRRSAGRTLPRARRWSFPPGGRGGRLRPDRALIVATCGRGCW